MERKMKWNRSRWSVLLVACFMLQLVGCSENELEERCFPMMVAVGYDDNKVTFCAGFPRVGSSDGAESQTGQIQVSTVRARTFEKSKEKYESHLNKLADYNHLKVVVIEDELLENTSAYNEMLEYLAESEEFPRNTYVCAVDDIEDLFEIEQNFPQDLGTYLEEYLVSKETKKDKLLTLGDLIDEKANQSMVLYMPYLEVEENYINWGGYVNNYGKIWKDF